MADKQTLQQFGASIKAKHPEYRDMDDTALGKAVLAKYPQYSDMVSAEPTAVGGDLRAGSDIPVYSDLGQDKLTRIEHGYPGETGLHQVARFTGNIGAGGLGLLLHPLESAQAVGHSLTHPEETIRSLYQGLNAEPGETIAPMLGQAAVTGGLGEAAAPTLEAAGTWIRSAAIGDPDVAALRGLRIPASSPKSLSTLRSVQTARPFLQGVNSLEDLQARVPKAKAEIWGPYQSTVEKISNKAADGPDGPTTVGELEAERQQLSALNRGLKQQNPEAIQLAQQKGMTQAQLLDREKAVQSSLDPHLEAAGIDPKLIRQNFGSVAQIGGRISGKSTLAETPQPFGFGKMANLSLEHPLQAPSQILSGVRDLIAGRPLWSGSPTDVALREAFRPAGPKPDFRAPVPAMSNPPKLLESDVPGNAPYGEEPYAGSMNGIPERNPVRVTPAPNVRGLLPETASEPNWMRRYVEPEPKGIRTPVPPSRLALPENATPAETQPFAIMRPAPPPGEVTRVVPSRIERLQQQGEILPPSTSGRLGLPAPEVPTPSPEPTSAHIYPAGSMYRSLAPETPFYPPGSRFRQNIKPFDIDEYLKTQTKPLQGAQ